MKLAQKKRKKHLWRDVISLGCAATCAEAGPAGFIGCAAAGAYLGDNIDKALGRRKKK